MKLTLAFMLWLMPQILSMVSNCLAVGDHPIVWANGGIWDVGGDARRLVFAVACAACLSKSQYNNEINLRAIYNTYYENLKISACPVSACKLVRKNVALRESCTPSSAPVAFDLRWYFEPQKYSVKVETTTLRIQYVTRWTMAEAKTAYKQLN